MRELLANKYFILSVMAIIVFAFTQVIKMPIKHFTSRIKNERSRKMVNATILIIPFVVGVALDFAYTRYYLHTASSVITGLGYGMAGISLYGVIERFFKVKVSNPYECDLGKQVVGLVNSVSADGKIDKNDKNAIAEFYNKVK